MDWLSLVLNSADHVLSTIPGIPPALNAIIVEAIQIAERRSATSPVVLSGAAKKSIAVREVFSHVDEPAVHAVTQAQVADAIDAVVKQANDGPVKASGVSKGSNIPYRAPSPNLDNNQRPVTLPNSREIAPARFEGVGPVSTAGPHAPVAPARVVHAPVVKK